MPTSNNTPLFFEFLTSFDNALAYSAVDDYANGAITETVTGADGVVWTQVIECAVQSSAGTATETSTITNTNGFYAVTVMTADFSGSVADLMGQDSIFDDGSSDLIATATGDFGDFNAVFPATGGIETWSGGLVTADGGLLTSVNLQIHYDSQDMLVGNGSAVRDGQTITFDDFVFYDLHTLSLVATTIIDGTPNNDVLNVPNGYITTNWSEYRTEASHNFVPVPGEDNNYQYTSSSVYDGVDAYVTSDYYYGEMISHTRIREYDNGIVHTDVYSDHGPNSSHITQSNTHLHTETNAAGVVVLEILKVFDVNNPADPPTKTFTYYDDSGNFIETIVQAPVVGITVNSQSVDFVRTYYDANDVITDQTFVLFVTTEEGEAYYDSLGLDSGHSLYMPYSPSDGSGWTDLFLIEIDSDGNILGQSTGTPNSLRHDMVTSTVSTVDGVTTITWTNNFGYQVVRTITNNEALQSNTSSIQAGAGIDTIIFSDNYVDYTFSQSDSYVPLMTHNTTGHVVSLHGVEQLQFDDGIAELSITGGGEFQINNDSTSASYGEHRPSVATLNNGSFIFTWMSYGQDGDSNGIFAQIYDANGVRSGNEFQVNTHTPGEQWRSSVTALDNGGFVITWFSYGQDGDAYGIYAQRYDANGTTQGSEFLVNTHTEGSQARPDIATLANGDFVITWFSDNQDFSDGEGGIYAQMYNANGTAQGGEFLVNTIVNDDQSHPSITALNNGGFIITWRSYNGNDDDIAAQMYNASGAAQGPEFQVNSYTIDGQGRPNITTLTNGDFVITWHSSNQDGSDKGVYAQMYNADGTAQGNEFHVNTATTVDDQKRPSITALNDGGFVISWMSGGSNRGAYAQIYDADGNTVGSEIHVNTTLVLDQWFHTSVTATNDGGFIVTWHSDVNDGSYNGDIFAQRYDSEGNPLGTNTLAFNANPAVVTPITNASTNEDAAYSYDASANFTDVDVNDVLTYSATLADGSALPSWLSMNGTTGVLSGTPVNADVGAINVVVTATDVSDSSVSDTYTLTVNNTNDTPTLSAIANASTNEDAAFSLDVSGNYADVDAGDTVSYSITGSSWASIDANGVITGTPTNDNVGTESVSVNVTDTAGAIASQSFDLSVDNTNDAPITDNFLSGDSEYQGGDYTLGVDEWFSDIDTGDVLTYSATLADGNALPSWLSLDATTGYLSGTPGNDDVGITVITVTATDVVGASVSGTHTITVTNINDAPILLGFSMSDHTAVASTNEDSYYEHNTSVHFNDIDTNDVLTYSATLADSSALPSWLSINTTTGVLSGTPLNGDDGAMNITVTATDIAGSSVSDTYTLTVNNSNLNPVDINPSVSIWHGASHNNSYYEIIANGATYEQASAYAQTLGGSLVIIDNAAENDFVYSLLSGASISTTAPDGGGAIYAWIGASDSVTEGSWLWADGSPVSYDNWGTGFDIAGNPYSEPDDYNGQDYAAIGLSAWPDGASFNYGQASQWNDVSGDNILAYVIEYSQVSGIPYADTFTLPNVPGVIDGGYGNDTLTIGHTFVDYAVGISPDGTVIIRDANNNVTTITEVEDFNFSDQSFTIASLQANDDVRPLFASPQLENGTWVNQYLLPDVFYSGNAGLDALYDYQYFGDSTGNILVASDDNDFINGFGGDDAINTGAGNDIVDGGLGSNFLTGGSGNDTFFSDGREAGNGAITWSTVTDFTAGANSVNIWGYIDGTSTYEWYADAGATGWTGATLHADLDGNGTIDTSMTFTGMDIANMSTPQGLEVGGNGYLLIG